MTPKRPTGAAAKFAKKAFDAAPAIVAAVGPVTPALHQVQRVVAARTPTARLMVRLDATAAQAQAMAERTGVTKEEAARYSAWRREAVRLRDRLELRVSKDKKKAHLASIEADLDALQDAMIENLTSDNATAGDGDRI